LERLVDRGAQGRSGLGLLVETGVHLHEPGAEGDGGARRGDVKPGSAPRPGRKSAADC